jgi:hypothetical protein
MISKGWNGGIFLNPRSEVCGDITKCEILSGDCEAPFDPIPLGIITIGTSSPWELNAEEGIKDGYDVNICYKCVSDNQPDGATFKWNVK